MPHARAASLAQLGLILLTIGLGGCCRPSERARVTTWKLAYGGRPRQVHVFIPRGHCPTAAVPLVVALHGGGGSGDRLDRATGGTITRAAAARGWVVAFPSGVEARWNDGRSSSTAQRWARADVDDVGFLQAVMDRAHEKLGIDLKQVYLTGISNGGFMALRMAVEVPDRVAAVAAVTATVSAPLGQRHPSAPVPVLFMNGTEDPIVPYDGGAVRVLGQERGRIWSTKDSAQWWRKINGCTRPATHETLPDRVPEDGTRTYIERSTGCASGAPVVVYRIDGGGHTWPGGLQYAPRSAIGQVARDFDGGHAIFEFFAALQR